MKNMKNMKNSSYIIKLSLRLKLLFIKICCL